MVLKISIRELLIVYEQFLITLLPIEFGRVHPSILPSRKTNNLVFVRATIAEALVVKGSLMDD